MPASMLDLFSRKALKTERKTATEWSAPCPACGGKDRCSIWPEDQEGRGYYWCRQCACQGDGIQFLRDFCDMTYSEACQSIGVAVQTNLAPPRRAPGPNRHEKLEAKSASPSVVTASQKENPTASGPNRTLWCTKATAFAAWAHARIWENPSALAWLATRGLDAKAVRRYGLGWNPGERGQGGLVRGRTSWGLPEQKKGDGKPHQLWLPVGLVIPQLAIDAEGKSYVRRLRIRRPEEERARFSPEQKYFVVPGSEMEATYLPCSRQHGPQVVVVVESDLDGLLLHHLAHDLVGVLVTMTSTIRVLPTDIFPVLENAACILAAQDFDAPDKHGNRAGAVAWPRWQETFPRAKRWPVPAGKDPGEAYEMGEDLRLWLMAGIPAGVRFVMSAGLSMFGLAKEKSAQNEEKVQGERAPDLEQPADKMPERSANHWHRAGAATPLPEAVLPASCPYSVEHLYQSVRGKELSDKILIPCPRGNHPWWWKHLKACAKCSGHSECIKDFITSPQMLGVAQPGQPEQAKVEKGITNTDTQPEQLEAEPVEALA